MILVVIADPEYRGFTRCLSLEGVAGYRVQLDQRFQGDACGGAPPAGVTSTPVTTPELFFT